MEENMITIPKWCLEEIEETLSNSYVHSVGYNLNCKDELKCSLSMVRKALDGKEITGDELIENLYKRE